MSERLTPPRIEACAQLVETEIPIEALAVDKFSASIQARIAIAAAEPSGSRESGAAVWKSRHLNHSTLAVNFGVRRF